MEILIPKKCQKFISWGAIPKFPNFERSKYFELYQTLIMFTQKTESPKTARTSNQAQKYMQKFSTEPLLESNFEQFRTSIFPSKT